MKINQKFKSKFLICIGLIFIIILFVSYKTYEYKIDDEIPILKTIYSININDKIINISLSYPNIIMDLITISRSNDELELFPKELNSKIFSIITKDEINNFIREKKYESKLKELNIYKKDIVIQSLDFFLPFIIFQSIIDSGGKINNKDEILIFQSFISYDFRISYEIYKNFFIEFKYKISKIMEILENCLFLYNEKYNMDQLIKLNYNNLKLTENCNIILNFQLYNKTRDKIIDQASSFFKMDINHYKLFLEKLNLGMKFLNQINYDNYLKFYDGNYIITNFPIINDDVLYYDSFVYEITHEFFHLFQDSEELYNKLIDNCSTDLQIKSQIDLLILEIDKFYENNKEEINKIYFLNNIFNIYNNHKSIECISNNYIFTFLLFDISSFSEISADIYALYFLKKYYPDAKPHFFYITEKFLKETDIDQKLNINNDILDINLWKEILKSYITFCLNNIQAFEKIKEKLDNMNNSINVIP